MNLDVKLKGVPAEGAWKTPVPGTPCLRIVSESLMERRSMRRSSDG
jgi:hypothetical protein